MKWVIRTVLTTFFLALTFSSLSAQVPDTKAGGGYTYGYYSTYSAAVSDLALASSATDIVCIQGSATRTIYVRTILIDGTATANTSVDINFVKRSTADTGGSSTTLTDVPYDSNDPSGTATVKAYTANPTVGTTVGTIFSTHLIFPTETNPGIQVQPGSFSFGSEGYKRVILRGTGESFCINLGGQTVTGGAAHASFEWAEQ